MNIYVGADHRGFKFKKKIIQFLEQQGHSAFDMGAYREDPPCDYPQIAYKVGTQVTKSKNARGILLCMTGIGQMIAANKVPGIYAALCCSKAAARFSREHNNSNVLVLSAKFVSRKDLFSIIKIWLKTEFAGGRHQRRVNQIKKMERKFRG